jgi:hypothetical protein
MVDEELRAAVIDAAATLFVFADSELLNRADDVAAAFYEPAAALLSATGLYGDCLKDGPRTDQEEEVQAELDRREHEIRAALLCKVAAHALSQADEASTWLAGGRGVADG